MRRDNDEYDKQGVCVLTFEPYSPDEREKKRRILTKDKSIFSVFAFRSLVLFIVYIKEFHLHSIFSLEDCDDLSNMAPSQLPTAV